MAGKGCTSLIRADRILTYIAHKGAASFTQLKDDFELPKSSLLNLLDTMVECGLLVKNDARQYQLGIKVYELGCQSLHRRSLFEISKRPMQELAMQSGLICHLGTIEDFHAIYLDKVESPRSRPTERSWVGKKLEFHVTALGKVLLAWKPEGELKLYLDELRLVRRTPKTITDRNLFVEELALTRQRGWGMDAEESADGAVCISAPVFDLSGRVPYAVSLSADPTIFTPDKLDGYLRMLAECTEQISRGLGYSGPLPQILALR
ncbi:IclR family transcriptional regulator [Sutterella sp.]|uniref:IclR family transcriptional regulator n=1 Tax=Sutterella sp. TaxID=1981025 RepID=UPI0026E0D1DD|nr:IclR family transcriptional regulator [Sutterella sp.]MDO5532018.1 IclR family transcriptional regulator [Sutterella sp.]